MISFHKLCDLSSILDLKSLYLQSLIAPMDGMWNEGFTAPSPHWEIRMDGDQAGYYAADDDGTLLQFYVKPGFEEHARTIFNEVVAQGSLTQAVVSTIDPSFLSICLDVQKKVAVHTYLYENCRDVHPDHPEAEGTEFRLLEAPELERTVAFQQDCLSSEEDLSGWLRGYSENLIKRKEIFVLRRDDEWLGIGECRSSDSQKGVTDLGMMVAHAHRGKRWAAYILKLLCAHSAAHGLRAICSTTVDNIGAHKAIVQAGFVSRHRIMNVSF